MIKSVLASNVSTLLSSKTWKYLANLDNKRREQVKIFLQSLKLWLRQWLRQEESKQKLHSFTLKREFPENSKTVFGQIFWQLRFFYYYCNEIGIVRWKILEHRNVANLADFFFIQNIYQYSCLVTLALCNHGMPIIK